MFSQITYGQTYNLCKVEVYLIKEEIGSLSNSYLRDSLKLEDLEDSALIKNSEILSYSFNEFKDRVTSKVTVKRKTHKINTSTSLTDIIDNVSLQKLGGRKFALLLDNRIQYWGYLISTLSSIVPESKVFANVSDHTFEICYFTKSLQYIDPRENKELLKCLKKTNRLKYSTKPNGS